MNSSSKICNAMIVQTIILAISIDFGLSLTAQRVMRFSQFETHIVNRSFDEVIDSNIGQYLGQHYITSHLQFFIPISPDSIKTSIQRCNEYYMDCVVSNSWIMEKFCDFTQFYMNLLRVDKSLSHQIMCPIIGDILIQNMTLNTDLFKAMLSPSLTDHWWENYWIWRADIQFKDGTPISYMEVKLYFLTYRPRARRVKT